MESINTISSIPSVSPNPDHHKENFNSPRIPPLLAIDTSTFHHITSLLSRVDRASLALTCKPILNTLGRQTVSIKTFPLEDRLTFLRHQQSHFQSHILCHWCGLFHPHAAVTSATSKHPCATRGAEFHLPGPTIQVYTLPWHHLPTLIREVPTGLVQLPVESGPFKMSQTIEHKVVRGKFLVCIKVSVTNVPTRHDVNAVTAHKSIACPHHDYHTLNLLRDLESRPRSAVFECLACRACMSYRIKRRKRGWELHCALWICLGDGRSPVGEDWVRLVRCEEKAHYCARKVMEPCEVRTWVMFEWLGAASKGNGPIDDIGSMPLRRKKPTSPKDQTLSGYQKNQQPSQSTSYSR